MRLFLISLALVLLVRGSSSHAADGSVDYALTPTAIEGVQRMYDDWRPAGPELWVVVVQLSREETNRLATLTRSNVGKQLNILWRGKVLFAPTIREEVKNGRLEIPRHSQEEGEALARQLEGGSTSEPAKDR